MGENKGIAYIAVNCYGVFLRNFRIIAEKFGIADKCHPYSFSSNEVESMIRESGLIVLRILKGPGDLWFWKTRDVGLLRLALRTIRERGLAGVLSVANALVATILSRLDIMMGNDNGRDIILVTSRKIEGVTE